METRFGIFFVLINFLKCNGDDILDQLRQISLGHNRGGNRNYDLPTYRPYRRNDAPILGIPSLPSDLPPSEAILPGHTLIRPSFGMLKSALKFPHLEHENGAGVYGNINNLGLRYGATNQRLLYSSFRRMPKDYVVVEVPNQPKASQPQYYVSPAVFDLENQDTKDAVLKYLNKVGRPVGKSNLNLYYYPNKVEANTEDYSYYLKPASEIRAGRESNKRYRSYKEIFASLDDVIAKLLSLRQEMEFASNRNMRREKPELNTQPDAGELSGFDASKEEKFAKKQPLDAAEESKEVTPSPKSRWWQTKNMFDQVKVHPDAPEFHEFLPKEALHKNDKQWWYFGQDDLTSLTKQED